MLRTAKVYQVHHHPLNFSGVGIQNALACIFEWFGIEISKQYILSDEYEVEREQLCELQKSIIAEDEEFKKNANRFESELQSAEIDRNTFLQILEALITESDQQNPMVLISWFDKDNMTKDLEYIKELYIYSDNCLGEFLNFIPADGLSIEEAFNLRIAAMNWCEGDRFFCMSDENEVTELKIE